MKKKIIILMVLCFIGRTTLLHAQSVVRVWEEPLVLPTYLVEPPEPNPIFFGGRAYQGAKGPIYPYPFLDRLTDNRVDKTYRAVYLENKYIKICILPEIGGRLFSALDKTNNYDFIYRQHVIKPALIGMLGAWISGGVEWNIPHHHRATTFMEVDHSIIRDPDGSATVWVGEIELRHRMKWLVGLTLHPDKSFIEVTMKVVNRTPLAHSMLAWANVAVHANPDYQIFFPSDVEFATFHGKNQFSRWPVSTEVYNRQDYTKGVDMSWWKSHAAPTSFFAWEAQGDFLAGYDHGQDAGVAFVADHNFVPGKKLWTWGTGSEGKLWERILTETDGPYAELMIGAFSDNQPDYSWIQPYEVRTVKQYWYPIRKLGGVKAANENGACNLTVDDKHRARIALQMTHDFGEVRVTLKAGDRIFFEELVPARPEAIYFKDLPLPADVKEEDLRLGITTVDMGYGLLTYASPKRENIPLPPVVTPPPAPKDIATVEELYLTGLRLEQFYNPAVEPYPYYEEALKRDPGDYRTNTALGLLYMKRAMYREAEEKLRRAVERASKNYTRPKDGEALYYLGVVLRAQGKIKEAEDSFHRAAWSLAWKSASFQQLAELAGLSRNLDMALKLVDGSLEMNGLNGKALSLKAAIMRKYFNPVEAEAILSRILAQDPLDFWARNELYLLKKEGGHQEDAGRVGEDLARSMRDSEPNYLELAADYGGCGFYDEAIDVLERFVDMKKNGQENPPLPFYFLGYFWDQRAKSVKADVSAKTLQFAEKAAGQPPDYVFPFQVECLDVLRWAQGRNPKDGRAPYYLGNYLFDLQPDAAMEEWKKAVILDRTNSIAFRNLGLAYARVKNDLPQAVSLYEKAVATNPKDPKLYFELDQLYEAARVPMENRLELLEKNHDAVARRDDSLTREILLLVQSGKYDRAINLLSSHHFHVWEGGGGIYSVFVEVQLLRGQKFLEDGNFRAALKDFEAALAYPANLDVAEPSSGGGSAKIYFLIGSAKEALGEKGEARAAYEKAAGFRHGWSEPSYYQALALRKLGRDAEAAKIFDGLIRFAGERLKSAPAMDFFEKFGEKQSAMAQSAQSHYLLGLGYLGKGQKAEARAEFEKALELNSGLTGASRMLKKNGDKKRGDMCSNSLEFGTYPRF